MQCSRNEDVHQRCVEYWALKQNSHRLEAGKVLMGTVVEAEEMHFDFSLAFMDNFVQESVVRGAKTYDETRKSSVIEKTGTFTTESELNFTPYERPTRGATVMKVTKDNPYSNPLFEKEDTTPQNAEDQLKTSNLKKKWTLDGYEGEAGGSKPQAAAPDRINPTPGGRFSLEGDQHYNSGNNLRNQSNEETKLDQRSAPEPRSKPPPPKAPAERKKEKIANDLFKGVVSPVKDEESEDSNEEEEEPPQRKKGKEQPQ